MEIRFRRGELERALWGLKAGKKLASSIPTEFATRIRRLLEIDRTSAEEFAEAGADVYAFFADEPGGRGHDVTFSLFDLQMLWLGLELIEMGFKQREVVEQLRFARPKLWRELGADLNRRSPGDPQLFLALPGVERSGHEWLRQPRPSVLSANELVARIKEGKLGKIALLPVGWQALQLEEPLQLAAPTRARARPSKKM